MENKNNVKTWVEFYSIITRVESKIEAIHSKELNKIISWYFLGIPVYRNIIMIEE